MGNIMEYNMLSLCLSPEEEIRNQIRISHFLLVVHGH